jgi:choline kinase
MIAPQSYLCFAKIENETFITNSQKEKKMTSYSVWIGKEKHFKKHLILMKNDA